MEIISQLSTWYEMYREEVAHIRKRPVASIKIATYYDYYYYTSQYNKHKLRAVIFHVQQHIINLFLSYSDRFLLYFPQLCWCDTRGVRKFYVPSHLKPNLKFSPVSFFVIIAVYAFITKIPDARKHEKEIYNHNQSDIYLKGTTTLAMWKRYTTGIRRHESFQTIFFGNIMILKKVSC